jgi:rod shape-determining protein MreC
MLVESKSTDAFDHVVCQPLAGIDNNKQLLILLADASLQPAPPAEVSKGKKDKSGKKRADAASVDAKNAAQAPKAAP